MKNNLGHFLTQHNQHKNKKKEKTTTTTTQQNNTRDPQLPFGWLLQTFPWGGILGEVSRLWGFVLSKTPRGVKRSSM